MAQSKLYQKYLISLLASASFVTSFLYIPAAAASNIPVVQRKPAMVEMNGSVLQAFRNVEITEAGQRQYHQAFEQGYAHSVMPRKSADVKEAEKLLIELRDHRKLPIEQSVPERVIVFPRQPVSLKQGQQFYQPVGMPALQSSPLPPEQPAYQPLQSQPQVVYRYQPQVLSQPEVTATPGEEEGSTVILMSEIIKVLDKVDSTLAAAGNNIASATDKTGKILKEKATQISSWIAPPRIVAEDSPVVDSDALISEWNNPDMQAVKEGKQRRVTTIAAIGQEQEPMAGPVAKVASDELPWKEKQHTPASGVVAGLKELFAIEPPTIPTTEPEVTVAETRSGAIDEHWPQQEENKVEATSPEQEVQLDNDQPATPGLLAGKLLGTPQPPEETLDSADIDKPEPVAEEYSDIADEEEQPATDQAKEVGELIKTAMPIIEKNTIVTIPKAKEEPAEENSIEKNKEVAEKSDLRIIEEAPQPVNKPQDVAQKENRTRKMRKFSVAPVMKAPLAARPAPAVNVADNVPVNAEKINQKTEVETVVATLSDQKKEGNTKKENTALAIKQQQAVDNQESRPVTTAVEGSSTIPSQEEEEEAMSSTATEREQKLLQVRDHMIKAIAELPPTPPAPDIPGNQEKTDQPVVVKAEEKPMISVEQQERAKAIMGNLLAKTKEIIAEQKQAIAPQLIDNVVQPLGEEYQKQENLLKEKVAEIQDHSTPTTSLAPPPLPVKTKPEATLTPAPLPPLPLNSQQTTEQQVSDIIKPVLEENEKAEGQVSAVVNNLAPGGNQAFFSVMFKGDTTELSPEGKTKLQNLLSTISQGKGRLMVIGYATDASNSPRSARRISLERAVVVRNFLISSGLESKRISVQALGDIITKPDPATQNRVDIFMTEDGAV